MNNYLGKWLDILSSWLDKFGIAKDKPIATRPPVIFKGKGWMLVEIERHTVGAVQTWRFNCHGFPYAVVISLDNLLDWDRHCKRIERQLSKGKDREKISREKSHRIAIALCNGISQNIFLIFDAKFIDNWSQQHAEDYKAEQIVQFLGRRLGSEYESNFDNFEFNLFNSQWWEGRLIKISEKFLEKNKFSLEKRGILRR